jgi:hypothetical protein
VDCQQAWVAVIENQAIRHDHFGTHRVAAEDHPSIKDGKVAEGPVKVPTLDSQILPALRARQLKAGSDLLPKVIR